MTRLRVLVTGATGLAGSHTVRALLRAGHAVSAFVRNPEKAERVFGGETDSLRFVQGDITDAPSVDAALERCDAVVHCAAIVAVEGMSGDEVIETNVLGVRNVIGGAVERGIERIVHVSSVASLMEPGGAIPNEDSPPKGGEHAYGQSKALCETYVRELQADGKPIKVIYPCAIVGPDDPGLTESMDALRIFASLVVVLTRSGFQLVDARDLGETHRLLVEAAPGPGRYLVGGHFLPWAELADHLERIEGTRVRRIPCPAWLLQGSARFLDVVRKLLSIEFPLTLESSLYVTDWPCVPTSQSLFDLGLRYRDPDETLADSVAWMRSAGHL